MKIGILNIYSFPHGMAPTNRILAYTKGLVGNGMDCEIISIKPQVLTKNNLYRCGIVNGAKYIHFLQLPSPINRIIGSLQFRVGNIVCFWKSMWYIFMHRHEYDTMILSFDQPSLLIPFITFLNMLNIRMVAIADEFPTPIRRKLKNHIPTWKTCTYKILSKYLSGRILMTQKLADFYNRIKPLPTQILSTITDVDRFIIGQSANEHPDEVPYLCYMGNMELSKDDIVNIIHAFHKVLPKYPNLKFFLYGLPSSKDKAIIEREINKLDLKKSVILKGMASYEEVPQILSKAKILVTSQPDTKRAEGGFPTKMGEYMMSGVPCILTDVGEISKYVRNKDTVFMVPPEDPQIYAEMMLYVLENYQEAKAVAERAQKYICNNFSARAAGQQIISFLNSL